MNLLVFSLIYTTSHYACFRIIEDTLMERRRLFQLAKGKNLRNSSSEDEEEPAATQPSAELVDISRSPIANEHASLSMLPPPEPATWSVVEQPRALFAFDVPPYFRQKNVVFTNSLICQYNIDEPIVDYNLCRFADDCSHRLKHQADHFDLNEKQKKYALEFYLEIDGQSPDPIENSLMVSMSSF